ncbi:hypothetical protein PanWU01x14_073370 [Parasponia andersonii]|uniref:Transmembrane protein n=1 Tax=Parasponia andersonii TaxID=3476 RepID=A0A2P5DE61_PARAD|nr:hypothetical protein PanWU01x14_073370 [Parasponia andersonii]
MVVVVRERKQTMMALAGQDIWRIDELFLCMILLSLYLFFFFFFLSGFTGRCQNSEVTFFTNGCTHHDPYLVVCFETWELGVRDEALLFCVVLLLVLMVTPRFMV